MRSGITSCVFLFMVWGITMISARNKSTITIFTTDTTWNEAYCICKYSDMDLLMAKTNGAVDVTNTFLRRTSTNKDYWFGLHVDTQFVYGYTYKWVDGSTLGTWTNWHFLEPDAQNTQRCVRIEGNTFKWRTMSCDRKYGFVCQKEAGSCTMELDHTIMNYEPNYNVTATHTQCIRICKVQKDNCFGVLLRSPSLCYIYESEDPTDFIRSSQNTLETNATEFYTTLMYRKVCFNSTIRTSHIPYTDSSDDAHRQCSLQYPSSSSAPTSPYTASTTAPIMSNQQSTSQEQVTTQSTGNTISMTHTASNIIIESEATLKFSSQTQIPSTSEETTVSPNTLDATEKNPLLSSVASTTTRETTIFSPQSTLPSTVKTVSEHETNAETISTETNPLVETETTSQLSVASTTTAIANLSLQSTLPSTVNTMLEQESSTLKAATITPKTDLLVATETTSQLSSVASTPTGITNLSPKSTPSSTVNTVSELKSSTSNLETISPATNIRVTTETTFRLSPISSTNNIPPKTPSITSPVSVSHNEETSWTTAVASTKSTTALIRTPQSTASRVTSDTSSSANLQNKSTITTTSRPILQTKPPEYFLRQKICGCPCIRRSRKTVEALEKETDELVEYLSVHKTATVSFQRKRASAPDDRTSAIAVGTIGVILICLVFGLVIFFDISRLVMYCFEAEQKDPPL